MVGINVPIPVPMAFHSFGGWKASLFGDHHMHGPEGVRFYTQLKTITSRWPTGIGAVATSSCRRCVRRAGERRPVRWQAGIGRPRAIARDDRVSRSRRLAPCGWSRMISLEPDTGVDPLQGRQGRTRSHPRQSCFRKSGAHSVYHESPMQRFLPRHTPGSIRARVQAGWRRSRHFPAPAIASPVPVRNRGSSLPCYFSSPRSV